MHSGPQAVPECVGGPGLVARRYSAPNLSRKLRGTRSIIVGPRTGTNHANPHKPRSDNGNRPRPHSCQLWSISNPQPSSVSQKYFPSHSHHLTLKQQHPAIFSLQDQPTSHKPTFPNPPTPSTTCLALLATAAAPPRPAPAAPAVRNSPFLDPSRPKHGTNTSAPQAPALAANKSNTCTPCRGLEKHQHTRLAEPPKHAR